jgi:hypothetical protein
VYTAADQAEARVTLPLGTTVPAKLAELLFNASIDLSLSLPGAYSLEISYYSAPDHAADHEMMIAVAVCATMIAVCATSSSPAAPAI